MLSGKFEGKLKMAGDQLTSLNIFDSIVYLGFIANWHFCCNTLASAHSFLTNCP